MNKQDYINGKKKRDVSSERKHQDEQIKKAAAKEAREAVWESLLDGLITIAGFVSFIVIMLSTIGKEWEMFWLAVSSFCGWTIAYVRSPSKGK